MYFTFVCVLGVTDVFAMETKPKSEYIANTIYEGLAEDAKDAQKENQATTLIRAGMLAKKIERGEIIKIIRGEIIISKKDVTNKDEKTQETALHYAARKAEKRCEDKLWKFVVIALYRAGADLDACNDKRETPRDILSPIWTDGLISLHRYFNSLKKIK